MLFRSTLMAPDPPRFDLFSSFQQMSGFRMCGNFWVAGTDGSVDQLLGSMGAGVFITPPDIRAWISCPESCMCGLGTVKGSMGTLPSRAEGLQRQRRLLDRVDQGFVDRWGVKVHGDPDSTRAEMAGILACLDKIPYQCHVVIGTDSNNALTILDRFRGKDSAPFVDGLPYRDLLEPILGYIRRRSAQGAKTVFMKVRAHRGLPANEVADDCAAKGHTSVISLGEDRERDRKSTRLNSSHSQQSRMPSSA